MNTHNKSGKVSSYGLRCGYVENTPTAKMWHEHGVYNVAGWDTKGDRIDWSGYTLKEARKVLASTKQPFTP